MDKSADITDTVQLNIFIKGIDDNFHVFEEFLSLGCLHGTTKGTDISHKLKLCSENFKLDMNKLISICTDGAPAMVGKQQGWLHYLKNS